MTEDGRRSLAAPDHPWVRAHPEWFTTNPDGTIAYAENPPKKYQDIYPLNFDNDPEGIYAEVRRVLRHWMDLSVGQTADATGRGPFAWAHRTAASLSPTNGRSLVRIWKTMHPREYRSLSGVISSARICSGLAYSGVISRMPVRVARAVF